MNNGESSYRRFLDGDQSGLVEIIRDYKDGLIFYLNGFVSDIHTAEELCEDTFVKIAVKKPRFSGKASFKTWLYAIGRNVALDYLRKNRKAKELSVEECHGLSADGENLERQILKNEQKITVHRALERLKPEYRQILWLTYFEELSNKEAATVMKKSVHSIETLVSRARKALKFELESEGFDYEKL